MVSFVISVGLNFLCVRRDRIDWYAHESQNPYLIRDTQEVKTTWHPVGA